MRKILDIVYMASSILGAFLIATNSEYRLLGYYIFIVSSISGLALLRLMKARGSLVFVPWVFLAINILGVVRS